MKQIKKNSWLIKVPIAHRGLHTCDNIIPENSLAAFENAISNNYAIELDIQLSKDNEIVVFHDFNLKRLCNIHKNVNELNLSELKKINLANSNEKIPTLAEVLNFVNDKVPLLIEIKNETLSNILESKLDILLRSYKGRFAIQSFNPKSLNWFYKNNKEITRGQLSYSFYDEKLNFVKKFLLKNMFYNFLSHPHFIAYGIEDLPNARVKKLRKKMPILSWTINSSSKLKKAKLFCDNIIFECIKL